MIPRLKRLHTILQKTQLDGILVSHQSNITYLTGAPSFDSYLLISRKQNFYITDSRYYQQAHSRLKDFRIKLGGEFVFRTIAKLALDAKVKRLGFEARNLDVAQHHQIKNFLGQIYFVPTHELIEELRKIKQSEELEKIKKAVRITVQALAYARKIIRPGLKEIEIAAQLEYFIRYKGGARTTSFETIVASGKNSSFPHHLTSGRRLKKEEILFIDVGVDYQGYKSDLTRTFFLGKISSAITKIYNIVRQAQAQAIKRIKPGVKISDIDQRARQYITKHGYGGFFAHNLGHGIGLEVHEQPHISSRNETIIEPGMVFTIEPGIYLPNKFGIRIEDDVIVTKNGCEVLSADLDK
ncbi:MAG: aminopeptidase P family protein [Candidatus Omnitrophica bacterium]|nr:aminopeptidase P family protein [Candidatus Omnitrophota bacterium]